MVGNVKARKTGAMEIDIEFSALRTGHGPQRSVTAELSRPVVSALFSSITTPGIMNGIGPATAAVSVRHATHD